MISAQRETCAQSTGRRETAGPDVTEAPLTVEAPPFPFLGAENRRPDEGFA